MSVNMIYKRSLTYRRSKLFLICSFILLMPTNHLGIPIRLKNVPNDPLENGYDTKFPTTHQLANEQQRANVEQPYLVNIDEGHSSKF